MTPQAVRALVVDDSAFMRRLISDLLESTGQIKVVGIARNGSDAVDKNLSLQPDVITLDIEMPEMDGLAALTELMRTRPVPIVMLSSLTQTGAHETFIALERGAVDFIGKPSSPQDMEAPGVAMQIVAKVLQAAQVDSAKLQVLPALPGQAAISRLPGIKPPRPLRQDLRIVAVGTSTGGPRALQTLFSGLRADGQTAYLVVQHMPEGFTRSLAERLDRLTSLKVREAAGEPIRADHVYIAPGGQHLQVHLSAGTAYLKLSKSEPVNGHRPAVDVLFHSLAALPGLCKAAVILTGMGSDGAEGLAALKAAGAFTIAEAADTAVIFGMPKAAVATGAVDRVVGLGQVAETILEALARKE